MDAPCEIVPPFRLSGKLNGRAPLLLASPHSGRYVPADFLGNCRLPVATLRRLEDAHVGDLLRGSACACGVPLLEARVARAVIDLNRALDEYDAEMIAGHLAVPARPGARVANGYGLFPRIAGTGLPIHAAPIPADVAEARIRALHAPWHAAIAAGLQAAVARHGFGVLLDMHSMPPVGPAAQIVLGSRFGTSAAASLVDWLQGFFEAAGLRVARNAPYAGGYTTARHGRPDAGAHVVQIEIDRSLYMDQRSLVPHAGFARLASLFGRLLPELLAALPLAGMIAPPALAAE